MSDALLLLARDDGAEASRSHTPAWNTSVQEVGGASSLWEEWRIREVRDVSVIGGSSRSGNHNNGKGKELLRVLTGKPYMNTKIPVYVEGAQQTVNPDDTFIVKREPRKTTTCLTEQY